MTKEFVKSVSYNELERAYNAYNALMMVYENACGGPYAARQFREYFAISDSRNNIREEIVRRSNLESYGDEREKTKCGAN